MQQTNLKRKKMPFYWKSKLIYYLFCLLSVKMISTERYVFSYFILFRKCQNMVYFHLKDTAFFFSKSRSQL